MKETKKRLDYVDVLKFIAITSVFIAHFTGFRSIGTPGVHIFLILSGYSLTKSYINKNVSYFNFLMKRILRIFPLYLTALAVVILTKMFILKTLTLGSLKDGVLISHLFGLQGFINPGAYNISFWFITLILQFYILFPLLLKILKKGFIVPLTLLTLIITQNFYSKLSPILVLNGHPTILYLLPLVLIGMYLATEEFKEKKGLSIPKLLVLLSLLLFYREYSFVIALVIFAVFKFGILKINFNLLKKLGAYSFGFYLLHVLFINAFNKPLLTHITNNKIVVGIVIFILSYAFSMFIEKNINKLVCYAKNKFSTP